MDPIWLEVFKQAPALAILTWIVVVFLKHLNDAAVRQEKREQERDHNLRNINQDCHLFQRELTERNRISMEKVSEALTRNATLLEQVLDDDKVRRV